MTSLTTRSDGELYQLALGKMTRVLGRARALALLDRMLAETGNALSTAQDLFRLGSSLTRMGGFEGAVGALLKVQAVMRGATPGRDG